MWRSFLLVLLFVGAAGANPIALTQYRQDDSQWANEKYDDSTTGETIGQHGCELTCWAMIMTEAAKNLKDKNGNPIAYTPKQLNDLLKKEGAYEKDANGNTVINVAKMMIAVEKDTKARDKNGKGIKRDRYWQPGMKDDQGNTIPLIGEAGVALGPDYKYVCDLVSRGIPVIVRVDALDLVTGTDGVTRVTHRYPDGHSVLVIGCDNGTITIADPLGTTNTLNDSFYTNKVYDFHTYEIPEPTSLAWFGVVAVACATRRPRCWISSQE